LAVAASQVIAGSPFPPREANLQSNLLASLVLALALSAAGSGAPIEAQPASGPQTKEHVIVRFTWKLKGEYAPLFVALDKGYYAQEGLDVELAEGSGAETVVKMIGLGTDQIAYGPATVGAEAVDKGLPVQVVAVYQSEVPIAIVSFPDMPLKTPKDLVGHTLGVSIGETFANLVEPFERINKLDPSKIKVIQMNSSARATQFIARKIDFMSLYLTNELPLFEKQAGVRFNVLKISDFGLKLMGAAFLINKDYAETHATTLEKLLRATARGYADAEKDYKGAVTIMAKHMTLKIDPDVLDQQVKATMDSLSKIPGKPLGWQSEEDWKSNLELLKAGHMINEVKDPHFYYTNTYLH
jgi:NitT/TauT family transport system substrate-binding protein